MSIDTHSPSVAGFRCEPITTDTVALPCAHSRLKPSFGLTGAIHRDDPAVLIGLTLAFVRQGPLLDGFGPEPLMLRLNALADGGNAACRLLLDWMRTRNRDLHRSRNEHLSLSASAGSATDAHPPRRTPRQRVLARIPKSGHIDGRRRDRTRPRDPAPNSKTAIIAAEIGGRIDG